jgi:hypothetical protein
VEFNSENVKKKKKKKEAQQGVDLAAVLSQRPSQSFTFMGIMQLASSKTRAHLSIAIHQDLNAFG